MCKAKPVSKTQLKFITMRNHYILFLCILFVSLSLQAQVPQKFNYQGIARDSNGGPLASQNLGLQISILSGTTPVFKETHNVTTNNFGLYTLAVGGGTPVLGSMSNVSWSTGSKFIKVEIDPNGGTNYSNLGTSELLSVPYAIHAGSTGSSSGGGGGNPTGPAGGDLSGFYPNPNIANQAITTLKLEDGAVTAAKLDAMGATNGQVLKFDGTNWVPQNIAASTGDNWGTQVAETDATLSGEGTIANPLGLADNAVITTKVADDAITTDKLAVAAVTSEKLHQMGATTNQVLKWNGTNWIPADEVSDNWGSQVVETDTSFNGDGTTATPLSLADAAITSSKIAAMGATNGQVLKFDGNNWLPGDDNEGVVGVTYTAGDGINISTNGEISSVLGTDIDTSELQDAAVTTVKITDDAITTSKLIDGAITSPKIADMGATSGQVLKFDGANWLPSDEAFATSDNWGSQVAVTDVSLIGDGTAINPLGLADAAVTSEKLAQMGATEDQVLKWNGTNWGPSDEAVAIGDDWGAQVIETDATLNGQGTAGSLLSIADNAVTANKLAAGAVTSEKLADNAITSPKLAAMGAINGQVLKYDGTNWIPQDETNDNWGAQVVVTDATLEGEGTTTAELGIADNAITTSKLADGAVTSEKLAQMGAADGQILTWDDTNSNWTPTNQTSGAVAFFEVDNDQITYADTDNFGKDLLINTNQINHTSSFGVPEHKMMFLPSKNGALRAGSIIYNTWDLDSIGNSSVALGSNTKATGNSSTAMGASSVASNQGSTAIGWVVNASGEGATALGYATNASGSASTALGRSSEASGDYSTAFGYATKATGDWSTAMGRSSEASGEYSIAMGYAAIASGKWSTSIGRSTEATGIYTTAMGISSEASGYAATSMGSHTKAFGDGSTSMGRGTEALGDYSTAMGTYAIASGDNATAMGRRTEASGEYATAMGGFAIASGDNATAMGGNSIASGFGSTAMGNSAKASGSVSTAMGRSTEASGNYSTAVGSYTKASGAYSTAMGEDTQALASNSTVMGRNVRLTEAATGSMFFGDASGYSFRIQATPNQFSAVFANGYRLYTNGPGTIGVSLASNGSSWNSISDRNKKENIKIADGKYFIESIKKMELGSWNYIGQDSTAYRHWGPMAQDFHEYFGNDGIGTIGSDTTIATADIDGVMMIAIKALADENDELKDEITQLKQEIKARDQVFEAKLEAYHNATEEMEKRLSRMEALIQRSESVYSEL